MVSKKKQTAVSAGTLRRPTTRQTRSSATASRKGDLDVPLSPQEAATANTTKKRKAQARVPGAKGPPPKRQRGRPPKGTKAVNSSGQGSQSRKGEAVDDEEDSESNIVVEEEAEEEEEEDEEEQDVEEETASVDHESNEGEEDELDNDFLRQRVRWKKVLSARASLLDIATKNKFKLQRGKASTACKCISEAISQYRLLKDDGEVAPSDKSESLKKQIGKVSLAIKNINLVENAANFNLTYRDLHVHVVPDLVALIDKVIRIRAEAWQDDKDLSNLQEVISHLERLESLCKNLSKYKNIATEAAFVKPVKKVIFPTSRTILQNLQQILNYRLQVYSNEQLAAKQELLRSAREAIQAIHRKTIEEDRKRTDQVVAEFKNNPLFTVRPPLIREAPPAPLPIQNPEVRWTWDEDEELILRLALYGRESNEVRYNECLLTKALQNKSADLIRGRALEYKKTLEDYYMEKNKDKPLEEQIPLWVSSIA